MVALEMDFTLSGLQNQMKYTTKILILKDFQLSLWVSTRKKIYI